MEFYLNQKSQPMIRKCGNCLFYYREYGTCSKKFVGKAYDHSKKIFLAVTENLYCEQHTFRNEEFLKREAVVVEYESLEDALNAIEKFRSVREIKKTAES